MQKEKVSAEAFSFSGVTAGHIKVQIFNEILVNAIDRQFQSLLPQ